jgi:putative tryptophan/tyrosine transport system substrate-binding protein
MRLIGLAVVLALSVFAAPLASEAQQAGKVYRIGYISPGNGPVALTETFREGLREFGYVEGRNLVIEYRWTGLGEPLAKLAAELVGLKPDVIVSVSHRVSLEVKRATSTIPVIFAHVNDPVGVGLVPSLAHPGGNVTGLSAQGLLKELVPSVFRIAYLGNPDEPYSPMYLREAQRAASVLGVKEVFSIEARTRRDVDVAFAALKAQHANALLVEPNGLNAANSGRISELALANRLPTMHGSRDFTTRPRLMSFGANLADNLRCAATHMDKIL